MYLSVVLIKPAYSYSTQLTNPPPPPPTNTAPLLSAFVPELVSPPPRSRRFFPCHTPSSPPAASFFSALPYPLDAHRHPPAPPGLLARFQFTASFPSLSRPSSHRDPFFFFLFFLLCPPSYTFHHRTGRKPAHHQQPLSTATQAPSSPTHRPPILPCRERHRPESASQPSSSSIPSPSPVSVPDRTQLFLLVEYFVLSSHALSPAHS